VAGLSHPLGTVAATAVRKDLGADFEVRTKSAPRSDSELWEHLDTVTDVVAPPERPTL